MSKFNATKKISITSVLFSLLILFFSLNGGFCTNFCSAKYEEDANEYSILEKSNQWDSNGNEEEGEEGSDEDDQNNPVDVYDFANTSVKVDQSGKISSTKHTYKRRNNRVTFNMEETASIKQNCQDSSWDSNGLDKDEYFAINADGTLVSKNFNEEEDYKEYSPSGKDDWQQDKQQPDVSESRYGDLCPICLML